VVDVDGGRVALTAASTVNFDLRTAPTSTPWSTVGPLAELAVRWFSHPSHLPVRAPSATRRKSVR
jgi:hypothetical protein